MSESEELHDDLHEVRYRVELSIVYHQKRERFFEIWDKVFKAIAVIGGSAAWAQMGAVVAAPMITVTSAISLVFNLSDRSKKHSELARSFRQLDAEMAKEYSATKPQIADWNNKCRQLEVAEPPALGMLVRLCQNELAVAQGQQEKIVPVGFFKRSLAHFFDLSTATK